MNSGVAGDPLEINYTVTAPTKICAVAGCATATANFDTAGNTTLYGNTAVNGTLTLGGDLSFSKSNPYLSASSYFVAPGGAYFSSGTVYAEAAIQARGGIHDDQHANLAILGGTSGGTAFSGNISASGSITASGNVYAPAYYYSSDRTLKTNIADLSPEASLANIQKLQGVYFDWKKDGKASVGLIAQDVEKVYPELVATDKTTGLKSVEYGNLVAPLIEAVKAQQKQIDALKAEVEALKKN